MTDPTQTQRVAQSFYRNEQEEAAQVMAKALEIPYYDLRIKKLNRDFLSYISFEEAIEARALPVEGNSQELVLASPTPDNDAFQALASNIQSVYKLKEVKRAVISHAAFDENVKVLKNMSKRKNPHEAIDTFDITETEVSSFDKLNEALQTSSLTDMLEIVLFVAIKSEASDIHIEPNEEGARIRYRIDGVLHVISQVDRERYKYLLSQLELTSKLKLNAKLPQNGRFKITIKESDLSIRVETMPSLYGEEIVMRIFNFQTKAMGLEDLGFLDYHQERLERTLKKPNGATFVVGPTGSGKTTTLYAIINKLNGPQVKIVTIEDPIEYTLEGATQTQINEGETFGDRLKAVLREDPDIVMVGEIRDKGTADTALQAGLTGHLVLTTLHANDSVTALTRLLDLSYDIPALNAAVNAIIGQRLVRKICDSCKQEVILGSEQIKVIQQILSTFPQQLNHDSLKFFEGKGCPECNGFGYKGRTGIFEILEMTPTIQQLIIDKKSAWDIQQAAKNEGMITMEQDGIIKALMGITSVAEVLGAVSTR